MKDKESTGLSQVDVAFLRAARAGNLEKVLNFLNENGDIHTCNANGLNALHLAAKEGHVHVVAELLNRGAAVNATTKKGNTALHIASLAGQKGSVDVLLENGASVNAKAQNGFTPLYMACQEGHVEVIRVLLSHGANQQVPTEDGFTPLDVAVQQGHDKVVAALLHHDSRKGYRSLHTAARKDYAKAAKLLLQKNHSPDVEAPNGFTPLHIACKYGNQSVGLALIDGGATIDYKTKNYVIVPLHVAAKYGHVHMVTLLVEKGSKVDIPNKDGLTPLHCGARDGHDRVVEYLLDKNGSVTARTKHGLTPLHMATQGSHVSTSAILLDHKAPVNAVAANGLTPLHIAAHYGHVDIAQLLLDRNADTDARARNGFTPLHVACKKNREPVILLLLKYGANVHSANEGGQTPMHVATYYGNVTLVLLLLQHGGSPDITNMRGETALHIACRRREIAIVRLLLRNGAAVDAKTQDRETPLHIAVRTKNTELVNLLLDHGASPDVIDKNKCTPLHTAARDGNEEIVEILLEHEASLTALSKKGFTPLHEAARYGHVRIVEMLLKFYETPDPEGKHGLTPLHVATHYDHSDVATLLLNNGADKDAKAKNGYSPLHIGGSKNRIAISLLLLNRGVDPDTVTKTGISPLHLAAKEGHVDLCEQLIEHGAFPGITTNNGLTSLHLAARENRVDVAKLLLKYNAPIDAQTVSGFTPLLIACVYGNYEVAELLLQNGANVEAQTNKGYQPLHLAAQYGHELIIHLLLKYNAPPDAYTKDGYTALYIARRVMKNTTIIETLTKVTKVQQIITLITQPGEEDQEPLEGEAIVFSAEPEELEEEEILEALELHEEETEPQVADESIDRYMTMEEMDMGDDSKGNRDSGLFARYSGSFLDKTPLGGSQSSDLDKQENIVISDVSENIVMTEMTEVESSLDPNSDLPSSLANMSADNVMSYEPPITGGFLISFVVDARGGKMESSQTGIKIVLPPKSCQMPSRITCKLHRLNKPTLLPPLKEGEALASRVLDVGPTGLRFLQPIYLELPHFAALRDGERELVVVRTEDGGWNWQEVSVEDMQGVNGYSGDMNEGYLPSKRYSRIVTPDFPERFAVISRLKKEAFSVGARGLVMKSSVVSQVQVSVPEGAVTKDTDVTLQVLPVDESFNDMEEWLAVSSVVTLEPLGLAFKKPVQVTIPGPLHSGSHEGDMQPSLRLLCCFPEEGKSNRGNAANYQWRDITDSTPLTVMNECARFSTSQPARYWLIETRNVENVTSDARLFYRKLSAVPYLAKFVVYAKVSLDGQEVRLRVFCITDDKTEKTLEGQTGYVEIARSRDVEVCEGRQIYIKCLGNLAPVQREPLQLNVTAFHENRLSLNLKVVDSSQPLTCRMAFLKEPRKDRQGNVHAICNLNIDASEESLKKADAAHRLPDSLLALVGQEVGADWVGLGQQLGFEDIELQEISDSREGLPHQCATEVLTKWRDKNESGANMASLEEALRDMGREDIANNFKKLAYASYAKDVGITVIEKRSGDSRDSEQAPNEADNKRISEFLAAANGGDVMFDSGSPAPGDEALFVEARPDSPAKEAKDLEGPERDKIIQEMFANDKGVLDFFSSDANPDGETEI